MAKSSKKAVKQIEHLKKEKFIETYKATMGNITESASVAGIARGTYYNWLEADSDFALQILDSEADLNDSIRQVLIEKAGSGDMTAVIFYLKNRHPDFKPQPTTLQQINIGEGKDGNSITFVNFKNDSKS